MRLHRLILTSFLLNIALLTTGCLEQANVSRRAAPGAKASGLPEIESTSVPAPTSKVTPLPTQLPNPLPTVTVLPTVTPSPTVTPAPFPSVVSPIVSLTLINADTDQPIGPLVHASTINLATLPTRNLNVRADKNATSITGVVFAYDANSNYKTETGLPYAMAGDNAGDYAAWTPTVGSHVIAVTPYNSLGNLPGLSVSFTVIDQPVAGPSPSVTPSPTATLTPTPTPTATPTVTVPPGSSLGDLGGLAIRAPEFTFNEVLDRRTCGCKHHKALTSYTKIDGSTMSNLLPGDTICLSGSAGGMEIRNIVGTPDKPIRITNCGGRFELTSTLRVIDSRHFVLSGDGHEDTPYGIRVMMNSTSAGPHAVVVDGLSSDLVVDHIEVDRANYFGIQIVTYPTCDLKANFGNFNPKNIYVHSNYIHDIKGPAIAVGHHRPNGISTSCPSGTVNLIPARMQRVSVYGNINRNIGQYGFKINGVISDARVFENTIENYAVTKTPAEDFGIALGDRTQGYCFNNRIRIGNHQGAAIVATGQGDTRIFNNVIEKSGYHGIRIGNSMPADEVSAGMHGTSYYVDHNTIVETANDGINLNSTLGAVNRLSNNLIVAPGSGKFQSIPSGVSSSALIQGNVFLSQVDAAKAMFMDQASGDFRLNGGSAARSAGVALGSPVIGFDLDGLLRPDSGARDAGACETP